MGESDGRGKDQMWGLSFWKGGWGVDEWDKVIKGVSESLHVYDRVKWKRPLALSIDEVVGGFVVVFWKFWRDITKIWVPLVWGNE